MQARTRKLLKSLGCELSHGLIQRTQTHLAAAFKPLNDEPLIERDLVYGPDARHRLDIFRRADVAHAPVLVFVHGGGFVMGDKSLPKLPFYENIGLFAANEGWIGVTINYRLAPDHMWPAGAQDVARAIGWLRDNIASHGGDPGRIFLMGQSAGAAHVATYLGMPHIQPASGAGIAGAIMVSGTYDLVDASPNAYHLAYYGTDTARYRDYSMISGLIVSNVPLCFAVAEFDGIDYRRQAALLVGAFGKARGDIPRIHWLPGHNHLSPILAIGTPDDTLGPLVRGFLSAITQD